MAKLKQIEDKKNKKNDMHKIIINRVSFVVQHKLYPTLFNVKKTNKKQ